MSLTDESKVEQAAEVQGTCAAKCCGFNAEEVTKRIEEGVNHAKGCYSRIAGRWQDEGRATAEARSVRC